jgi:hypothetical protein
LGFLLRNGGKEGADIVNAFNTADSIDTIRIAFVNEKSESLQNAEMNANHAERAIYVADYHGGVKEYNALGSEAAKFGHEMFHLLHQSAFDQGTVPAEKEAYDFQATLLNNMNITMGSNEMVKYVHENSDPEKIREQLQMPTSRTGDQYVKGIGSYIDRVFFFTWQLITNCYGRVCLGPEGPPSGQSPLGQALQVHLP